MPEKKSDSKIMAMLERTGVIRKVGKEDGSLETDSGKSRSESNIKPVFDAPDNTIKAARQPIPGMPTPVFPSDSVSKILAEQDSDEDYYEPEPDFELDTPSFEPEPVEEPTVFEPPAPPAPPPPPPPAPVAAQKPASAFTSVNPFKNGNIQEDTPFAPLPPAPVERGPQPENYTDRYLNTEELYDALSLRSKKTDSIYLIEEYLRTLPDSLPDAQRRDIVNKLLAASGFDYDLLMGDGVLRVKMLKEYAERFARHTDDYIAARQAELDEMDQQILRVRRLIENRRDLHKKQFFSIEAEAQRLKEILTFISG